MEPIIVRSQFKQGEMENMLTIDEGESLNELLKNLDR